MHERWEWEDFPRTSELIREWLEKHVKAQNERERRMACPNCNPTAKAMRRVQDLWIAAGIGRD